MNIKKYKYLSIKGAVLDNLQLQSYMEKIASNHDVNGKSKKETYPIYRLKSNFKYIEKTYNLLNEHVKLGIEMHPAGEWLLDNFYIIEETYKTVCMEMNLKRYEKFPSITNGIYKNYARIYVLASEIVAYTDNKIDDDVLYLAISSYQKKKLLSMEEIWSLWLFLEIAIIENIRNICERIYSSQLQKYKVESIIERLVIQRSSNRLKFNNIKINIELKPKYKKYNIGDLKFSFIEYMSYKLKKFGKKAIPYLEVLDDQVRRTRNNSIRSHKKGAF